MKPELSALLSLEQNIVFLRKECCYKSYFYINMNVVNAFLSILYVLDSNVKTFTST